MECNCGGETQERQIVKNKEIVCQYQRCKSCGRQLITRGSYPEDNVVFTKQQARGWVDAQILD
jgi:hypothetical protein